MKIKYNLNKDEYNKYLKIINNKTDYIYLTLYTIMYFYITYYLFNIDFKEILLYYSISIVIIYIIICLIKYLYRKILIKKNNKFLGKYDIEINKDDISIKINLNELKYKINDVKKTKNNKLYIIIKFKNKALLIIPKKQLKEEKIKQLIKLLEE